jgi:uncharacterized small protein (DUF1192 family)
MTPDEIAEMQADAPAAYQYRWKIDGAWVNWRFTNYSQKAKNIEGLEERPLYSAATITAQAAEIERLTAEKDQLEQDLSDMRDNAESAYRRGYGAGGNGS